MHADRWASREAATERELARGRAFVFWGIVLILGTEAVATLVGFMIPITHDPRLYTALPLHLGGVVFLYRGSALARWGLFVLAMLYAFPLGALCVSAARGQQAVAAAILGVFAAAVIAGGALLACPSVGVFQTEQRRVV